MSNRGKGRTRPMRELRLLHRGGRRIRRHLCRRPAQAAHTPQDRGRKAELDRESSLGSDWPLSWRPRLKNQWVVTMDAGVNPLGSELAGGSKDSGGRLRIFA